jgi:hypothetical protein
MIYRMLNGIAVIALLALAACSNNPQTASVETPAPDATGWRLASGKAPTKAEFAALAATCEDQTKGGSFDACLSSLGLKRSQ